MRDVAINPQDAAIHRRRTGVSVCAGEDQRSAADLFQRAGADETTPAGIVVADDAINQRGAVIAADDERVAATDIVGAIAFDRTGRDAAVAVRAEADPEIDDACAGGDEARIAAGGIIEELVLPPSLVMIVALPAVVNAPKLVRPSASLIMVALPAVAVSDPDSVPNTVPLKSLFTMVAEPAED